MANGNTAKNKPGFFERLFGLGAKSPAIEIGIMPVIDAAGQNHARDMTRVFSPISNVRAKIIKSKSPINPDDEPGQRLPNACASALSVLGRENLDLVIWGEIPEPGTTISIYFASAPPVDDDPPGSFSPFQPLMLPVGFDPDRLGGLLLANALTAIHPATVEKKSLIREIAASAVDGAAMAIANLPEDSTPRETTTAYSALANAMAAFAHLFPGTEIYQRAAVMYGKALKSMMRSDGPINWAYLKKNQGMVLHWLGKKNRGDLESLELAEKNYREALEVFSFENTPFPWAATQARLGDVLYRLDLLSGGTDSIKDALGCFQSALKVFGKKHTPNLWSDVMNSFAQAAQVLGREKNNAEAVERAVAACRSALEVRKRKTVPLQWAATNNNLGSALFILGRLGGELKHFEEALDAFKAAREVYEELGLTRMVRVTEKNMAKAEDRLPSSSSGTSGRGDPTLWWMEGDEDEMPEPEMPEPDERPAAGAPAQAPDEGTAGK